MMKPNHMLDYITKNIARRLKEVVSPIYASSSRIVHFGTELSANRDNCESATKMAGE